ncbi:hypothetical protein EB820_03885 [Brevibacillus agri]|uniref:Uncharacterized protein n=1 Tax=Brevibacillus agri TaxID=51101 RepID=A0A3M8BA76_9BACL|nr:hypothetical protein [Brevibacillus agri]QAV14951.1 hypothetical protein BA6348_20600 [Brevibacillus agri]RNB59927.1 hypothetical protein EB820_03885 [Brevibacillus agri]
MLGLFFCIPAQSPFFPTPFVRRLHSWRHADASATQVAGGGGTYSTGGTHAAQRKAEKQLITEREKGTALCPAFFLLPRVKS